LFNHPPSVAFQDAAIRYNLADAMLGELTLEKTDQRRRRHGAAVRLSMRPTATLQGR
jgi:hypothetical protein